MYWVVVYLSLIFQSFLKVDFSPSPIVCVMFLWEKEWLEVPSPSSCWFHFWACVLLLMKWDVFMTGRILRALNQHLPKFGLLIYPDVLEKRREPVRFPSETSSGSTVDVVCGQGTLRALTNSAGKKPNQMLRKATFPRLHWSLDTVSFPSKNQYLPELGVYGQSWEMLFKLPEDSQGPLRLYVTKRKQKVLWCFLQ